MLGAPLGVAPLGDILKNPPPQAEPVKDEQPANPSNSKTEE